MFTGIITAKGHIANKLTNELGDKSTELTIVTTEGFLAETKLGDSIAVNGVCLTVVGFDQTSFTVEVSEETISRTNLCKLDEDDLVNLEHSLRFGDSVDGHMVQGHVDTTVLVEDVITLKDNKKVVSRLTEQNKNYMKYIAEKGSVTLNGVSLTVNSISHNNFAVNIIPHTLQHTNLNNIQIGDELNLEVDMFARYCVNFLEQKLVTSN